MVSLSLTVYKILKWERSGLTTETFDKSLYQLGRLDRILSSDNLILYHILQFFVGIFVPLIFQSAHGRFLDDKFEWMNWMNFVTYIPPMKPEGQAQGCILRRSMVINPLDNDSPVRMYAIISLLAEWELGVF